MAHIILWPAIPVAGSWEEFEPTIRGLLAKFGGEKPMVDWICIDMGKRWSQKRVIEPLSIQLSACEQCAPIIGPAIERMKSFCNDATTDVIIMSLGLEVELYYALFPPPPGGNRVQLAA
jgi:hypothetical protein